MAYILTTILGRVIVWPGLVATPDPANRTIVTLYCDSAAAAISPIIAVGAISGSIIVASETRLRSNSHAADWSINGNLS